MKIHFKLRYLFLKMNLDNSEISQNAKWENISLLTPSLTYYFAVRRFPTTRKCLLTSRKGSAIFWSSISWIAATVARETPWMEALLLLLTIESDKESNSEDDFESMGIEAVDIVSAWKSISSLRMLVQNLKTKTISKSLFSVRPSTNIEK